MNLIKYNMYTNGKRPKSLTIIIGIENIFWYLIVYPKTKIITGCDAFIF